MIALAVLGALSAVLATLPRVRSSGHASKVTIAGYVLMGASMLVFVILGLRG